MQTKIYVLRFGFLFVALLVIFACGSGGGGGGDGGGELVTPSTDITGSWSIQEVIDDTDCGGTGDTDSYTAEVVQSGNTLTVTIEGEVFTGTISGSTVSWTGSYPDDGGTTTITSLELTVSSGGTSLTGTASWTFTNGVSCSGTTQVTGTFIS